MKFSPVLAALMLPFCAIASEPSVAPASVRAQLAPTGTLRMAMTQTNFFVTKDPGSGELRGVAIELGRALAQALGVSFDPLLYRTRDFDKLLASAVTDTWDVAIMGFDLSRESLVAYTAPVMEIDLTLLVTQGSRITSIEDMDRPGHRIAVSRNTIVDLALSRVIKAAEIVRDHEGGLAELVAGRVDAYASQRPVLIGAAKRLPGSRVLDGRFDAARPALALSRDREASIDYLRAFVEHAKRSGLVANAIQRAGIAARVAPPAEGTGSDVAIVPFRATDRPAATNMAEHIQAMLVEAPQGWTSMWAPIAAEDWEHPAGTGRARFFRREGKLFEVFENYRTGGQVCVNEVVVNQDGLTRFGCTKVPKRMTFHRHDPSVPFTGKAENGYAYRLVPRK